MGPDCVKTHNIIGWEEVIPGSWVYKVPWKIYESEIYLKKVIR